MAKTLAQRQAAYRASRATASENGQRQLNTWITTGASLALSRLARRYGVTNKEMLERLILNADRAITDTLDPDSDDWAKYFSVTQ